MYHYYHLSPPLPVFLALNCFYYVNHVLVYLQILNYYYLLLLYHLLQDLIDVMYTLYDQQVLVI